MLLALSPIDSLIDRSHSLVKDLEDMQLRFHIKATRTSVKRNENIWEKINARKDSKQDRSNRI